MAVQYQKTDDALERYLEAALEESDDPSTKYYLRQALQLRITEYEWE